MVFADLVMDSPLEYRANEIGENIREILNKLNINSTNFFELKNFLNKNVNFVE